MKLFLFFLLSLFSLFSVAQDLSLNMYFTDEAPTEHDLRLASDYNLLNDAQSFDCSFLNKRLFLGTVSETTEFGYFKDSYFLTETKPLIKSNSDNEGDCFATHFVIFNSLNTSLQRPSNDVSDYYANARIIKFFCIPEFTDSGCGFSIKPSTDQEPLTCQDGAAIWGNLQCKCSGYNIAYYNDKCLPVQGVEKCASAPFNLVLSSYTSEIYDAFPAVGFSGQYLDYAGCYYVLHEYHYNGNNCYEFLFRRLRGLGLSSSSFNVNLDFEPYKCGGPNTGLTLQLFDRCVDYSAKVYTIKNVSSDIYKSMARARIFYQNGEFSDLYALGNCAYKVIEVNRLGICFDVLLVEIDKWSGSSVAPHHFNLVDDYNPCYDFILKKNAPSFERKPLSYYDVFNPTFDEVVRQFYLLRQSQNEFNSDLSQVDFISLSDLNHFLDDLKPFYDTGEVSQQVLLDLLSNLDFESTNAVFLQSLSNAIQQLIESFDDISTPLDSPLALPEPKVQFDFTHANSEIEQAKADYITRIKSVNLQAASFFSFSNMVSEANLNRCFHFPMLSGDTKEVCLSRYQDELTFVGVAVIFTCSAGAMFILLGRRKRRKKR